MKYFRCFGLLALLFLSGCASNSVTNYWGYPPMSVPLQPGIEQEVSLAKINTLIADEKVNNATKAKLYKLRGYYHDSIGLRDLARLDYQLSLKMNPKQADVLNMLGVFYTQVQAYDNAIDAFDISLTIDPQNTYTIRNRAIALYYGHRFNPALDDMKVAYKQDPNDPYTSLWMFYIQREMDKDAAYQTLQQNYQQYGQSAESQWGWILVGLTLGDISEQEVFENIAANAQDNVEMAQQLTETYFYLAKEYGYQKDYSNAIALYKLSLAQNVYEFAEHHYSFVELGQIFDALRQQDAIDGNLEASGTEEILDEDSQYEEEIPQE